MRHGERDAAPPWTRWRRFGAPLGRRPWDPARRVRLRLATPAAAAANPETGIDRIADQPAGKAQKPFVIPDLVSAALDRLTQEHRDVLRELYLRGNSVAQASDALGIAPGTVKSRAYYALRALLLAVEELRGAE
jgi:RNA polymerase sigma-70 factor, ECF subfamily